ncbi:hypothetical protein D3C73_1373390 [compost metagenome]
MIIVIQTADKDGHFAVLGPFLSRQSSHLAQCPFQLGPFVGRRRDRDRVFCRLRSPVDMPPVEPALQMRKHS